MSAKILTISIASYNAEKDISKCLDSIIASNVLDKLDIIVVMMVPLIIPLKLPMIMRVSIHR